MPSSVHSEYGADSLPRRFSSAHSVLLQAVQTGAFPGAAYGVLAGEAPATVAAVGRFTYEEDSRPVQPATVFDMASVSKVMATTAMAMLLWERGRLDLDRPVGDALAEFVRTEGANSAKRSVTPRMLLAHASGLPAYERLYERYFTRQSLLDACLQVPLEAAPLSRTVYSDIGFIVLGHLLETIAGETLDEFCQREVFWPLGMASTMYCPPQELRETIPPTGTDARRGRIQGQVHDDNCYVLGGVGGHAGVFSNVADALRFAQCILRGGAPIFRPETVALFTTRLDLPRQTSRALGWDTPSQPSSSGHCFSAHSVGHLGYTGTSLWIDMERQLAIALLTNRTFAGERPEGMSREIQRARPQFHDAVMEELQCCK